MESPTAKLALERLLVPSIPLKLNRGSETGRPDDLFLIPGGRPLFIEFKDPGGQIEPKQLYWKEVLEELGYAVEVHNSSQEALCSIAYATCVARRATLGAPTLHAEGREVAIRTWLRRPVPGSRFAKDEHYARSLQFLKEAGRGE